MASVFSAVVPGLGQVYNKKIWKVPIIYVSLGTLFYYFDINNSRYQFFKDAYKNKDTILVGGSPVIGSDLLYYRDHFRRNRDLNIIGMATIYVLNIIDANVDANLYDFDVSDNLSMRIEPAILNLNPNNNMIGLRCRIKF